MSDLGFQPHEEIPASEAPRRTGIGVFLRTGGLMEHPDVMALAGVPQGYRIVGIISVGWLSGSPEPTQRRKSLDEIVSWRE